jgi:hypothetical protein
MEGCWHKTSACSLQRQLRRDFQAVITLKWSRKFYEKLNYRENWKTLPCVIIFWMERKFFLFFFYSNSRIRPMAHSGFYEFHLLHGLQGSLFHSGLYQKACFATCPSFTLSTCPSQPCLYLLILLLTENAHCSFPTSLFLLLRQTCTGLCRSHQSHFCSL